MAGRGVDQLAPDTLLEEIEIRRRLRATMPWKHRDDSEFNASLRQHG
jgi:hypothetical protein